MAAEGRGLAELRAERWLVLLLRLGGCVMLLATFAILLPTSWMVAVHAWLGMGELPRAGIVEYLTRSVSALYAVHGGLLLVLSRDVRRYAGVIAYLGAANVALGGVFLAIDLHAGMPWYWTIGEGPPVSLFGVVILALVRSLPASARL